MSESHDDRSNDRDHYFDEYVEERLAYEAELRAKGELPPEENHDENYDEDYEVLGIKTCIEVDKCHTFQAVAEDGDLFLYFGIDTTFNQEFIFTKWKPALLENLRDVCTLAINQGKLKEESKP